MLDFQTLFIIEHENGETIPTTSFYWAKNEQGAKKCLQSDYETESLNEGILEIYPMPEAVNKNDLVRFFKK